MAGIYPAWAGLYAILKCLSSLLPLFLSLFALPLAGKLGDMWKARRPSSLHSVKLPSDPLVA